MIILGKYTPFLIRCCPCFDLMFGHPQVDVGNQRWHVCVEQSCECSHFVLGTFMNLTNYSIFNRMFMKRFPTLSGAKTQQPNCNLIIRQQYIQSCNPIQPIQASSLHLPQPSVFHHYTNQTFFSVAFHTGIHYSTISP